MNEYLTENTIETAQRLLGMKLIHETPQGRISGRIVEVEAYLSDDPASHSFRGKTARNTPMFGKAGTAYIYFTYGMHHCFNVVTAGEGIGEAVLVRALEPLEGIELMKQRRRTDVVKKLCSGPAKLVQALGIDKEYNGVDLQTGPLQIEADLPVPKEDIMITTRIGITQGTELPQRFYIKDSPWLSR